MWASRFVKESSNLVHPLLRERNIYIYIYIYVCVCVCFYSTIGIFQRRDSFGASTITQLIKGSNVDQKKSFLLQKGHQNIILGLYSLKQEKLYSSHDESHHLSTIPVKNSHLFKIVKSVLNFYLKLHNFKQVGIFYWNGGHIICPP